MIVALDAETGELRWQFDPQVKVPKIGNFGTTCRGVSYYRAPETHTGDCVERIVTATTDARMFAVDAKTGARCASFGGNGEINLLPGMGDVKPGFYFVTSPPTIARGRAIIGGWVMDNQEVGEPSGVVRAFDVLTGKFVWAWDMGRPGVNTEPGEGEWYTRGTPNVWSLTSYDDKLGLVYVPTGNETPDYYGAHRSAASEKYASSVVALDVESGDVRWSFQTVHHDIWDYDVPSQPVLFELPQPDGTTVPALVQGTKRGELFLLDRRTGTPLAEVRELPVPQGAVPGDWTPKTQPFSVGMPQFRGPDLTEADMWGLTPLDQLWCRIEFRKLRYEGHFTPPTLTGTLQYPGNAGGFNWGSVAIDEENLLMVVNPLLMSNRLQLYPRDQIPEGLRVSKQAGTPYAMTTRPFMSPLFVPCQKPPYGTLGVVDLKTREVVWNKPVGTTNESGPFGIGIKLSLPMGVPQTAGTIVTKGGLIFIGGTMDRYFRAFDLRTGEELWHDYLPATAHATPMSYLAPKTQRQVIVLTVPNSSRRFRHAAAPGRAGGKGRRGGRAHRGVCASAAMSRASARPSLALFAAPVRCGRGSLPNLEAFVDGVVGVIHVAGPDRRRAGGRRQGRRNSARERLRHRLRGAAPCRRSAAVAVPHRLDLQDVHLAVDHAAGRARRAEARRSGQRSSARRARRAGRRLRAADPHRRPDESHGRFRRHRAGPVRRRGRDAAAAAGAIARAPAAARSRARQAHGVFELQHCARRRDRRRSIRHGVRELRRAKHPGAARARTHDVS